MQACFLGSRQSLQLSILLILPFCGAVRGGDAPAREVAKLEKPGWVLIDSVRISPDGKRVAVFSRKGVGTIWEVETGKEIESTELGGALVRRSAFSPDGKLFAVGLGSKIRVWDLKTGKHVHTIEGRFPVFSPNGRMLAFAATDGVGMFDTRARRQITVLKDKGFPFAFMDDGRLLMTWRGFDVQFILLRTFRETQSFQTKKRADIFARVTASSDGKYVALGSGEDVPEIWNVVTGKKIPVKFYKRGRRFMGAITADGKYYVAVEGLSQEWRVLLSVYSISSGERLGSHFLPGRQRLMAFDMATTTNRIVAAGDPGTIRVWDIDPSKVNKP